MARSKLSISAVLGFAAALAAGPLLAADVSRKVPRDSAAETPEILWTDPSHSKPWIVTQALLSQVDWSRPEAAQSPTLPLTDGQRANLGALLNRLAQDKAHPKSQACRPQPVGDSFGLLGPHPSTLTIEQLIDKAEVALLAEVVRLEPAWAPSSQRPSTIVALRPDAIIKGTETDHAAGYSSVLPYGAVEFGLVRDCLSPPPGSYVPRLGDQMLVLAWRDRSNPGNLHLSDFFQVVDSMVLPGGLARERSPVPLESLLGRRTATTPERQ